LAAASAGDRGGFRMRSRHPCLWPRTGYHPRAFQFGRASAHVVLRFMHTIYEARERAPSDYREMLAVEDHAKAALIAPNVEVPYGVVTLVLQRHRLVGGRSGACLP